MIKISMILRRTANKRHVIFTVQSCSTCSSHHGSGVTQPAQGSNDPSFVSPVVDQEGMRPVGNEVSALSFRQCSDTVGLEDRKCI